VTWDRGWGIRDRGLETGDRGSEMGTEEVREMGTEDVIDGQRK
jgi:hypothetical protein